MTGINALRTLKMGPTNCYLLKSRRGFLLIDTSFPACFQPFLERLKEIHVDPAEIKDLLLTHSHDDHAGFAAELKEKTGCRIIAHKNSIASLNKGSIISVGRFLNRRASIAMSLYNWSKHRNFEYPPVHLDEEDIVVVGDDHEDILKAIGVEGRILHTPGHTDDNISVILANGDAFVGDACMSNLSFLHYRPIELYDSDLVFESWRKIIKNGAKTVYPGHGKPFAVEKLIRYERAYAR